MIACVALVVISGLLTAIVVMLGTIARNIYVLQKEIRYIFDLWQEHDTRWRQS